MTYRESLKIGSSAEGIIKCTYARLYDKNGNNLFSLQRKKAGRYVYYPGNDTSAAPKILEDKSRSGVWFEHADEDGYIAFDLPMVTITEISDDRLVPAVFTPEAIEVIRTAMEKVRAYKFTVYRVWDAETPGVRKGDRKAMQSTYVWSQAWKDGWRAKDTDYFHHEFVQENVINPRFEKLIDIITSGENIYIKPAAFEWYATDVKNATVITTDEEGNEVEINLDEAIEAARKKMENAKKVLIGAGLSNLL